MVRLAFTACWSVLLTSLLAVAPARAIEVGDIVIVKKDGANLKRGYDIVATVRAGQELQVRKISGTWIGTAVEIEGQLVGGWILESDVSFVRKGGAALPPPVKDKPAASRLAEIIDKLGGKEGTQQLKAVDDATALGRSAAAAVPKLTELLSAKSDQVRWRAARALAAIGPTAADAVPDLAKCLSDPAPLVRAQAAHALGQIGPAAKPVVRELGKLIADPDVRVRRATVAAWRNIRPGPEASIPIFLKVLEDAEGEVKIQAMLSIAEAGRDAVPGLTEALKNEKARYWACLILQHIGPDAKEAIPALLPLFKDELPQVRMQALMALAEIGTTDAEHVSAILPLLKDKENSVRYAAAYALTKIGPPAKAASEALKECVDDADSFLAAASAWALARVNDKDADSMDVAVTKLVAALKDKHQGTRVLAAKALIDLQPPPERVAPALAEALHDADDEVLDNVTDALAAHGEKVLPRAVSALKNEKLRLPAIMLVRKLGDKAKGAVPTLVQVLNDDGREEVRHAIIEALQAIGTASEDSVPALISMLTDDNLDVRRGATFALGKIGPAAKSALPAMQANFESKEELRPVSIWAMVHIAPRDDKIAATAVPLLIAALKREEGFVRLEAAKTLGLIGPRARAAIPALEAVPEDSDEHVRHAVAEALKKIKG